MAYGFDASTGFSRASWSALRRILSWSGESVEASAWSAGVESVGISDANVGETGGSEGAAVIRAVISSSCLSREEVVRVSGRERVRFTVLWKARRSCFRFAGSDSEEFERSSFACASISLRVSLGVLPKPVDSDGGGGLGFGGSAGSTSPWDCLLDALRRNFRPARRSELSLGAPVAKRTRSRSTWNMSPGFS